MNKKWPFESAGQTNMTNSAHIEPDFYINYNEKNIFLLLAFLSYFLLIVSCGSNNNKVEKKDILPMIGNVSGTRSLTFRA
jgi:hypothetical protein